ncbi:MAG: DUF4272 domain-containing protein [Acutalibacteraceae bacterium]
MDRKEKSRTVLEQYEIPFYDTAEAVDEKDSVLRSPHEIAKRAIACLLTLQIAGDMYYGNDVRKSKEYFWKLLKDFDVVNYLTENEKRFVYETPSRDEALDMIWQYEACQVLLWALGLTGDLDFPDQLCESKKVLGVVLSFGNFDELMKKVHPLPLSIILDETDIVCRMDYACIKAKAKGEEIPAGISREVLHERKRALFWLIHGQDNFKIWDEELI